VPARLPFALLIGLLAVAAAWAQAPAPSTAPAPPQTQAQAGTPSVSTQTPMRAGPVRAPLAPKAEAKPVWAELTPLQQQSLAPLAGTWRSLAEAHKRKWIALSVNYPTMPPGEQVRLHSRMAEWAALSPQQRTQARLNFAETQAVAPTDKKAKWEAYQALPPEEKRKLAAGAVAAKPPPPPTAVAVQPAPQKLAKVPRPKRPEDTARIAGAPGQVNQNTLLPQPGALPVQP
jgi:hypothetical protein